MAIIALIERILLWLVAVPVAFVILDVVLELGGAVATNPIVAFVDDTAALATPSPLTTIFPDQGPVLTAALVCLMYGLVAMLIAGLFRLVRQAVAAASARRQRIAQS